MAALKTWSWILEDQLWTLWIFPVWLPYFVKASRLLCLCSIASLIICDCWTHTPDLCFFIRLFPQVFFIYWNWYPNLLVYFGYGLTSVLTNDLLNWIDPFNILLKLGCELCLILLLLRDWCMLVCGLNLFCEIGPKTMLGLDVLWFADLLTWVKWQSQITINYFREVNSSVAYW